MVGDFVEDVGVCGGGGFGLGVFGGMGGVEGGFDVFGIGVGYFGEYFVGDWGCVFEVLVVVWSDLFFVDVVVVVWFEDGLWVGGVWFGGCDGIYWVDFWV